MAIAAVMCALTNASSYERKSDMNPSNDRGTHIYRAGTSQPVVWFSREMGEEGGTYHEDDVDYEQHAPFALLLLNCADA